MSERRELGLLGLPERFERPFSQALLAVGGQWRPNPRARLAGLQGGIVDLPAGEEPLTRAFDALCALIRQDTSIRLWCDEALPRARYKADPRCVIARCDEAPCSRICGVDQWSTPYYHRAVENGRKSLWKEDCDGIELTASGLGAGKPLFVLPESGKLGHVMHCRDDAASGVSSAIDYCIPAGMRRWRGPRQAMVYVGGVRKEGVIRNDDSTGLFTVKWSV